MPRVCRGESSQSRRAALSTPAGPDLTARAQVARKALTLLPSDRGWTGSRQ
jgi:hypothetical protein